MTLKQLEAKVEKLEKRIGKLEAMLTENLDDTAEKIADKLSKQGYAFRRLFKVRK